MKLPLREQIYAAFCHHYCWAVSTNHPIRLIPLTGQTFAVGLAVTFLGMRTGTMSILIYLLLGLIGLPVFAGGASGIGVLFGPTGGYLIGFIFNGLLTGKLLETGRAGYVRGMLANIAGALATLFLVPYG